jgi:hypothetical protein
MFKPSLDEGMVSTTNTSFASNAGPDSSGTRFTTMASEGSESLFMVFFTILTPWAEATLAMASIKNVSSVLRKFIGFVFYV